MQRTCAHCGKSFRVSVLPTHPRFNERKHCSSRCYAEARTRPVAHRFWEKVKRAGDNECWNWLGAKSLGYGKLGVKGRSVLATHISYEAHIGPIPDGMYILHHCDNPSCVNPKHLYPGTAADNIRDCLERGRFRCRDSEGEKNVRAKLTADQVREIRVEIEAGDVYPSIAAKFGVSRDTICNIKTRKTWAHI